MGSSIWVQTDDRRDDLEPPENLWTFSFKYMKDRNPLGETERLEVYGVNMVLVWRFYRLSEF